MNTDKPFDSTKPCQTRGGDPVRILTTDALGSFPIYYQNEITREVRCTFSNGKAWSNLDCERDLVNVPIKLVGWMNIYKSSVGPGFTTSTFATEAAARTYSNDPDYIETRQIEVEVQ